MRWAFQSFLCVENVEVPPIFVAAVGWLGSGRDGPGWRVAWCRVIGHLSVCAALRWPAQPTIFDPLRDTGVVFLNPRHAPPTMSLAGAAIAFGDIRTEMQARVIRAPLS